MVKELDEKFGEKCSFKSLYDRSVKGYDTTKKALRFQTLSKSTDGYSILCTMNFGNRFVITFYKMFSREKIFKTIKSCRKEAIEDIYNYFITQGNEL